MQPMIFHQIKYWVVDYISLEQMIVSTFGKSYSIVEGEEFRNDSVKEYSIDNEENDEYALRKIEEFRTGKSDDIYLLRYFLRYFCNKGIIESGNYLVRVCW